MKSNTSRAQDYRQAYERSQYRIIGKNKHSALKPCHWLIEKLFSGRENLPLSDPSNRNCYKGYFGIKSEKCIQCTPALPFCTHNCVFCWRDMEEGSLGSKFTLQADEPGHLVKEFIKNQLNMLDHHLGKEKFLQNYDVMAGIISTMQNQRNEIDIREYQVDSGLSINKVENAIVLLKTVEVVNTRDNKTYKFNSRVDPSLDTESFLSTYVTTREEITKVIESAYHPSHAAISLAGEPTLYPHIAGLVEEFRKRDFTTFIVSNGTTPDVLESMPVLPTQLYITLPPPDEKLYIKIHRPSIPNAYNRIMKTLHLLPSLSCRTCLRITQVKGLNDMSTAEAINGIINLVKIANPNFLEIKGMVVEARAMLLKKRLGLGGDGSTIGESLGYAPSFKDVFEFARALSIAGGYPIVETSKPSRDVLMLVNWNEGASIKIETP